MTLYAHIDLDLDKADGLSLNGQTVQAGDLISRHLYSGTVGGPHLHFEIRYYRSTDSGDEEFYGFAGPRADPVLTQPSGGSWLYGIWNPSVGYGFGDPRNHGVTLYQRSMLDRAKAQLQDPQCWSNHGVDESRVGRTIS